MLRGKPSRVPVATKAYYLNVEASVGLFGIFFRGGIYRIAACTQI